MSRRANGTNRAAGLCGGSRYTGYARPKKKAVSLAELNGRLVKKTTVTVYQRRRRKSRWVRKI